MLKYKHVERGRQVVYHWRGLMLWPGTSGWCASLDTLIDTENDEKNS